MVWDLICLGISLIGAIVETVVRAMVRTKVMTVTSRDITNDNAMAKVSAVITFWAMAIVRDYSM